MKKSSLVANNHFRNKSYLQKKYCIPSVALTRATGYEGLKLLSKKLKSRITLAT